MDNVELGSGGTERRIPDSISNRDIALLESFQISYHILLMKCIRSHIIYPEYSASVCPLV